MDPESKLQFFNYYLHDAANTDERRKRMENQGIKLSEEAWESLGKPFYEVGLYCEVSSDGVVRIRGVI